MSSSLFFICILQPLLILPYYESDQKKNLCNTLSGVQIPQTTWNIRLTILHQWMSAQHAPYTFTRKSTLSFKSSNLTFSPRYCALIFLKQMNLPNCLFCLHNSHIHCLTYFVPVQSTAFRKYGIFSSLSN